MSDGYDSAKHRSDAEFPALFPPIRAIGAWSPVFPDQRQSPTGVPFLVPLVAVPVAIHRHPEHRFILLRLSGSVTSADLIAAVEDVFEGGWDAGGSVVMDLRGATSFDLGAGDTSWIGDLVARAPPSGQGGRTAFVVGSANDDAAARTLMIWSEGRTDRERRIHYNSAAAAEWLGVPLSLIDGPWT